ncbi:MAG: ABC transporter permease [Saprospiraceae bacterium]|nr:ABC transporter permease [Saprospiraceae bacterium]MBK6815304.1 ABC transporter permease [Saprospiraceae bacterium]MBK7435195.1 ABC transporter permease [Saprospiraceae bacterium]MBK8777725.1 ABC transporter permease [Saprospiraceae bacterium]MBK9680862.1 ABC transporter permease [Saprospiraceae bacterium]
MSGKKVVTEQIIITPDSVEKNYWRDLWRFRELFYILSWRDLKVRYKQTALGVAWSVIRPVLTTIIFYVVFNRIAKLPTPGTAPYMLMIFAGMVPWQFFSNALSEASNSLVGNSNLISKVYFPRMIIPASSVITSMVDLLISLGIMVIMFVIYQFLPGWHVIFLPVFILIAFIASFGIGLYITALNVKYRDFRYIIPFIIQFGLYVTPVGFSSSVVPAEYRLLYALNPMVGVIDGFRWCLLGEQMYWPGFWISMAVCVLFLWVGVRHFRKTEKSFADVI